MRKLMTTSVAVLGLGLLTATSAFARDSFSIGFNVGGPAYYGPPPAAYYPAPPVVYQPAPQVIYRPAPGYYSSGYYGQPAPQVIYSPAPIGYIGYQSGDRCDRRDGGWGRGHGHGHHDWR